MAPPSTKNTVNELIRLYLLGESSTDLGNAGVKSYDYTVYQSGSTFKALNDETGLSDTQGTAFTPVMQYAMNNGQNVLLKENNSDYVATAALTISQARQTIRWESGANITFDGSAITTGLIKMMDTTVRGFIHLDNPQISSSVSNTGLAINMDYFTVGTVTNAILDSVNQGIDISNGNSFYNTIINPRLIIGGASGFGIRFAKNANDLIGGKTSANTDAQITGINVTAQSCNLYNHRVEGGTNDPLIGLDVGAAAHDTCCNGMYLEGNDTNLQLASGVKGFQYQGGTIIDGDTANITDNGAVTPYFNCLVGNITYNTYFRMPEQSGASDPTSIDIPNRQWCLWRTTTGGAVQLWYNDNGTLKKVTLT